MISLRNVAYHIARGIGREVETGQEDIETIRFGMEIILGAILKGIVVFGISYVLGILPVVTIALLTSGSLRLLSGGAHCNTYSHCLIFGTGVVTLTGLFAIALGPYFTEGQLTILILINTLLGFYIVEKWSPVDNAAKPITSEEKRRKFKKLSVIYVFCWSVIISLFTILDIIIPAKFSLVLASIGGFTVQILSLCPYGHSVVSKIDEWLGKLSI